MGRGRTARLLGICLLICMVISGCGIGPAFMKGDRIKFNKSVEQSTNEQMLLNLVRLKYIEAPFFLQIGAISSSFNVTAGASLAAQFPDAPSMLGAPLIFTYQPTLSSSFAQQPTITYTPLEGEQYVTRVLTEVTLDRIVMLHRTGWSMEHLLRILVQRIGAAANVPVAPGVVVGDPGSYMRFLELVRLLSAISNRGDLEFTSMPLQQTIITDAIPRDEVDAASIVAAAKEGASFRLGKNGTYQLVKPGPAQTLMQVRYADEDEARRLEELLGVQPKRYPVAGGRIGESFALTTARGIAPELGGGVQQEMVATVNVQLRSFMEALFFLSDGVVPPESAVKEKLVKAYPRVRGDDGSIIEVHSSAAPPTDAFISIYYRGSYFYIKDSDLSSKYAFGLLITLFSLQSGNVQTMAPLLTLPVGAR